MLVYSNNQVISPLADDS